MRVLRRFFADRRGGVAMIFGLALIPTVSVVGAALDYGRALTARAKLSAALDAAALAGAREPEMTDEQLKTFVKNYMAATVANDVGTWDVLSVTQVDGRVKASVTAAVPTVLMGVVGIDTMPLGVQTEVARDQKIELVMALDNTGSMNVNNKIGALRTAAQELVDALYKMPNAAERVKVGLVPFVTAVNIKATTGFDESWIDKTGGAKWNMENFSGDLGELSHWHLFQMMNGFAGHSWKGCVEARTENYDLTDDVPDTNLPDTLFVPYFWPDEPDSGTYSNSYLEDTYHIPHLKQNKTTERNYKSLMTREPSNPLKIIGDLDDSQQLQKMKIGPNDTVDTKQRYLLKYMDPNPTLNETAGSNSTGPNKGCPTPLTPLTSDTARLKQDIAAMLGWNSSGTNIAEGMAWGWRVVSPDAPFSEGADYSDPNTIKAMVVLTDGENVMVGQNNHNKSHYSGYGYLAQNRLGSHDPHIAATEVNKKVEALCAGVKAKNIRLYTITFQLNSTKLQDLFRNCATDPSLYYDSPSTSDLKKIFQEIGRDLGRLRIAK